MLAQLIELQVDGRALVEMVDLEIHVLAIATTGSTKTGAADMA
jgi:hypothetical protein